MEKSIMDMDQAEEFNCNILVTGVTGLIGRHVLYELLRQYIEEDRKGHIYVLVRSNPRQSAASRLDAILTHHLAPDFFRTLSKGEINRLVRLVDGDLSDADLHVKIRKGISGQGKLYVIHCAGSVNLFDTPDALEDVILNNYRGTMNLLNSLSSAHMKFIYMSTVFSSGKIRGILDHDYSSLRDNEYRNPYERYKSTIEQEVEQYCRESGTDCQILRPSVVCGRLHEAPLYVTNKFDVIYGWVKFFWQIRKQQLEHPLRVHMEADTSINVVPVDYVAKIVVRAYDKDIKQLNMVYPYSMNNRLLYSEMLETIGFSQIQLVDQQPTELSRHERHYYRLIGKVYGPYINQISNEYDLRILSELMGDVETNKVDLIKLTEFAITNHFNDEEVSGLHDPLLSRAH